MTRMSDAEFKALADENHVLERETTGPLTAWGRLADEARRARAAEGPVKASVAIEMERAREAEKAFAKAIVEKQWDGGYDGGECLWCNALAPKEWKAPRSVEIAAHKSDCVARAALEALAP